MGAIITLLTDFGLADGYVAAMKGVILGINPQVQMIDICHSIQPQNVSQAAFVLGTVYRYFPPKTIHLMVVDPGVGSSRKLVILRTPQGDFVAPDNGVLAYVLQPFLHQPPPSGGRILLKGTLRPESDIQAVQITNPRFYRHPVSPTFNGRDILAPVAAALSLGFSLGGFGPAQDSLEILPISLPVRHGSSLVGHIIHSDGFGNLITDIRENDLPDKPAAIIIADQKISGLSSTYAEGHGLLALVGSSGYLEIALKGGSAQALLGAKLGDEVRISRRP